MIARGKTKRAPRALSPPRVNDYIENALKGQNMRGEIDAPIIGQQADSSGVQHQTSQTSDSPGIPGRSVCIPGLGLTNVVAPFQGFSIPVLRTQGDAHARGAHVVFPWAILFSPLRGIFANPDPAQ